MLVCKHCFRLDVEKYLIKLSEEGDYWSRNKLEKDICLCYKPLSDAVDVKLVLNHWLGEDRDNDFTSEHINIFIEVVSKMNSIFTDDELTIILKNSWYETFGEIKDILPVEDTFEILKLTYNEFFVK